MDRGPGRSVLLLRRSRGPGGTPVFCVHGIGGSVLFFLPVARRLAADRPVYGVACAGLDPDQEPDRTLADMVARYVRELRQAQPEGPYLVVGYSLGGLVAHAMAQALEAAGEVVELVGLIDTMLPRGEPADVPRDLVLNLISRALVFPTPFTPSPGLDWDAQRDELLRVGGAHGVLPPGFSRAHLQRMIDLYDINQRVGYDFSATPVRAPVRLLVTVDGAAVAPAAEWLRLGGPGSDVTRLDADHFALMSEAHAEQVAAVVARWLREADGTASTVRAVGGG